jgi:hypothetical protein
MSKPTYFTGTSTLAAVRLAQQGDHLDRGRPAGGHVLEQPAEREAGVDDVLDDQDVLVDDLPVEVLEDPTTPLLLVEEP